jgi:ABC-type antimicrobial peptide transport system permease subunit
MPVSGLGPTERNLAYRAGAAYADATGWPTGFAIEIDKRIPVGGGLGGPRQDGHRRIYMAEEVVEISVIAELRRKGFSLQKIRRVLRFLQKDMGKRLSEALAADSDIHLLTDGKTMFRHVFRNAFVPLVQYIPNSILFTVMGSIYVESLYSVPGMGGLLVNVIQRQDNTMVQALVLIYSAVSIAGLLIGDILMAVVDPRISLAKKEGAR